MAHALLLEPDRLLANTYKEALIATGHSVVVASTAQQAIHAADLQKPDLVILEIQLVGHSGIEFLYEFRSYVDWMQVPVIVNTHVPPTEFSASQDILMHELTIRQYLYKPQTSLRQFVHAVADVVSVR